jgi:predicted PurR-regulated permease PerM
MDEIHRDLTRTVLAVLFIGGLIGASFWILRPFLGAIIWAVMIVVSTWPAMLALQGRLWGKRRLAVTVMTLALLSILVLPLSLALGTILANAETIVGWAKSLATFKMPPPPPPAWLEKLPLVGAKAAQAWGQVAAAGIEGLAVRAAPYAGGATRWVVAEIGGFGMVLFQFLLTVVLSAILYTHGERAASGVSRFALRLAGPRGENALHLASQAIRGVALGVVVTALAQAVLADRPRDRRRPLCRDSDRRDVHAGDRPDRSHSCAGTRCALALLDRQIGLGNVSAALDPRGRHHG